MEKQKKEIIDTVARQKLEGVCVSKTLKDFNIQRSAYYRWLKNGCERKKYKSSTILTPHENTLILEMKNNHLESRHRKIQGFLQNQGTYISPSSVYRALKSCDLVEPYYRRQSPLKKPFYEVVNKNIMWGADWSQISIAHCRWYLLILIDFFSRYIIHWDIVPSVRSVHIQNLYKQGLSNQKISLKALEKPILRVDQGSPNKSFSTEEFFDSMGADLSFSRVHRPTDNAITERQFGTMKQEEIYVVGNYPDSQSAKDEIGKYVKFFIFKRPHQSLWNFTPAFAHEINNKTLMLKHLKELKKQSIDQRKEYWSQVPDPDPDPDPDKKKYLSPISVPVPVPVPQLKRVSEPKGSELEARSELAVDMDVQKNQGVTKKLE